MLEQFQASTYKTDPFVTFLRRYFKENVCLLCGRMHRLYIHGYVGRLVRNAATFENDEIVICVIICPTARHEGRQYTKSLVPPFVIPECNISLENVLQLNKAMPDGRIDYKKASRLARLSTTSRKRRRIKRAAKDGNTAKKESIVSEDNSPAKKNFVRSRAIWVLIGVILNGLYSSFRQDFIYSIAAKQGAAVAADMSSGTAMLLFKIPAGFIISNYIAYRKRKKVPNYSTPADPGPVPVPETDTPGRQAPPPSRNSAAASENEEDDQVDP
jgi:hypothetical protein